MSYSYYYYESAKHNFLPLLPTFFDSVSILLSSFAFSIALSAASIAAWSKLFDWNFVVLRTGFGGVRGFSFTGGGERFTSFSTFSLLVGTGFIIVLGLSCSYSLKSSSSLLDESLNTLYLSPVSVLSASTIGICYIIYESLHYSNVKCYLQGFQWFNMILSIICWEDFGNEEKEWINVSHHVIKCLLVVETNHGTSFQPAFDFSFPVLHFRYFWRCLIRCQLN